MRKLVLLTLVLILGVGTTHSNAVEYNTVDTEICIDNYQAELSEFDFSNVFSYNSDTKMFGFEENAMIPIITCSSWKQILADDGGGGSPSGLPVECRDCEELSSGVSWTQCRQMY